MKFKDPLLGNPPTRQSTDAQGLPRFEITPNELTPPRAKLRDEINDVVSGTLTILGLLAFCGSNFNLIVGGVLGVFGWATYLVLGWFITSLLRKQTRIVLSAEAITLPGLIGGRHYKRTLEHHFQLLPHDRAMDEQLKHELELRQASAKGKILQKKIYYGNSWHVVLAYAGHRIDIADVYGPKEASAIIDRLVYCDRVLDQAMDLGGGVKSTPDDDWPTDGPGGLGGFGHV